MLVNLSTNLAGVLIFLFIFWKRLKDDYSSEIIFKTAFGVIIGITLGWILSVKFLPGWFFFLELIGGLVGLFAANLTQKIRFYETLEALVIAVLPWLSLIFLKDSVISSSLSSFLAFITSLLFILIFYFIDTHYMNFSWYKSGKIGFSGLSVLTLFFVTRATLAVFTNGVLSFVDKRFEAIISLVTASICFLALFNLGKEKK